MAISGTFGITSMNLVEATKLLGELGYQVFTLPDTISDGFSFSRAVRATLPLDPPIVGALGEPHWDALKDSIWNGLDSLEAKRIAILWPNAGEMMTKAWQEFVIARDVLRTIATTLANPEYTCDEPKDVIIILEGATYDQPLEGTGTTHRGKG